MSETTPYNDENIDDSDDLIRRINPIQHVIYDQNRGCRRVSSKAFSPSSEPGGGMSVDQPKLINDAGIVVDEFVTNPVYTGSVVFSAGAVREVDLLVGSTPLEDNPYHADVWGKNRPNRFSKGQQKAIQRASAWFVPIPGVELEL